MYINPREIFTAKFLGEANFLTGTVNKITDHVGEVTVNGSVVRANVRDEVVLREGENCVLAIRPEFIEISRKPKRGNIWECTVESTSFMGDYYRFELRAMNDEIFISKIPVRGETMDLALGDTVYANLLSKWIHLYRYPEEGLEKALSLE
jgi:ABC-type Fe3+/spermidine/putrescine transport system ATPase subunit